MNRVWPRAQQLDLRRLRLLHLQDHAPPRRTPPPRPARSARPGPRRRRRRARCPRRRRTGPAPRGRARSARGRPPGVSATRYSSGLISVGTPTFIMRADPASGVVASTSKRAPRCSSSGNRSSGSTQRSGGSAPRASIAPARQQPHGGGRRARRSRRPRRRAPTARPAWSRRAPARCAPPAASFDHVRGHRAAGRAGSGLGGGRLRSASSGAPTSARSALQHAAAGATAGSWPPRSRSCRGKVRSSECSV